MNQTEFRIFYRSTYRPLWSYLYRMVRDTELSNDLAQESYFRLLKAGRRASENRTERAYLFTIATNLVRDHWRSGKIHGEWEENERSDEIDDSAEQLPLQIDLANAMQQLSLMHRSLLWLCYVEGYTHVEVAEIVGLRSDSVRVLLSRARTRLAAICRESGIGKENQ